MPIGFYGAQFRQDFRRRPGENVRPFLTYGVIGVFGRERGFEYRTTNPDGTFATHADSTVLIPPVIGLFGVGVQRRAADACCPHRREADLLFIIPLGVRLAAGVSIPVGRLHGDSARRSMMRRAMLLCGGGAAGRPAPARQRPDRLSPRRWAGRLSMATTITRRRGVEDARGRAAHRCRSRAGAASLRETIATPSTAANISSLPVRRSANAIAACFAELSACPLRHLHADAATLRRRLADRVTHFAGPALVEASWPTRRPADALSIDATCPPDTIVARIRYEFGL